MREAQWPFAPLDKGKSLALAMGWLTIDDGTGINKMYPVDKFN